MSENRYNIIQSLGKSRTGEVFAVEDSKLNRPAALRRFLDENEVINFSDYKEDFVEAAQTLSNLLHPNLLKIYDVGMDDEGAYIASQLLEGESLHEEMKRGPMHPFTVRELANQLLDAYSLMHDQNCFHGALTPSSILMTPQARGGYRYIILDLGLTKLIALACGEDAVHRLLADPLLVPESLDGAEADVKGDLYMLGQLLYQCLAGEHPFEGTKNEALKAKHLEGLAPLTDYVEDVPEDFVKWLNKLTAVDPVERYVSAVEALNALNDLPQIAPPIVQHVQAPVENSEPQEKVVQANPIKRTTAPTPVKPATAPVPILAPSTGPVPITAPETGPVPITVPVAQAASQTTAVHPISDEGQEDINGGDVPQPISKKLPIAIIGGVILAVLGVSLFLMLRNSESNNSDSGESVITYYDGLLGENEGWEFQVPGVQTLDPDGNGWLIQDNDRRSNPGVRFSLDSHVERMFNKGWKISYRMKPIAGSHRVGFLISKDKNPGWHGGGNVACSVIIKVERNRVKVYSPLNNRYEITIGKLHSAPKLEADAFYTVTIEQEANAIDGQYVVKVDDEEVYRDKLAKDRGYPDDDFWMDYLFISGSQRSARPTWILRDLTLELQ